MEELDYEGYQGWVLDHIIKCTVRYIITKVSPMNSNSNDYNLNINRGRDPSDDSQSQSELKEEDMAANADIQREWGAAVEEA
jgi:hypothetical protein